jgi:hypothetical protein
MLFTLPHNMYCVFSMTFILLRCSGVCCWQVIEYTFQLQYVEYLAMQKKIIIASWHVMSNKQLDCSSGPLLTACILGSSISRDEII